MEFLFSHNPEVVKHLDPKTGKIPIGGNFAAFNSNWISAKGTVEDISDFVRNAQGLCAWHLADGTRIAGATSAQKAGLLIIDIDNQADCKSETGEKIQLQELTPDEAKQIQWVKDWCSLGYYSPSTTDSWPRFRLVFGLEKPIFDHDFYKWLNKKFCESIPGADVRATTIPNLFYGTHPNGTGTVFLETQNYIPANVIDALFKQYAQEPKNNQSHEDPAKYLDYKSTHEGPDLTTLVARDVRNILEGGDVDDRSSAMANVFRELIGWANFAREHKLPLHPNPEALAKLAFENIYGCPPGGDTKYDRILASITNPDQLRPAVSFQEDGDLAVWRKYCKDKEFADKYIPEEIQQQLKDKRPDPVDSTMNMDRLFNSIKQESLEPTPVDEPVEDYSMANDTDDITPNSDDGIVEHLHVGNKDDLIYDELSGFFYTYDTNTGSWKKMLEQTFKKKLIGKLDSLVKSGLLRDYNSNKVKSIFELSKAKFTRYTKDCNQSIFDGNRSNIPFTNGKYDTVTASFKPGLKSDDLFLSRLNFDWNASAKCPKFVQWLDFAVGKELIPLIQAFSRAILVGYTQHEKFCHLIGAGGSGKSTLQQVFIALAGYQGTHTSDLETLETNRFEAHALIGKRLLVLTDEAAFSKRLDMLKKLTSATDLLRAEQKYSKNTHNFKPHLLVTIASNQNISSSDLTSGLERRRLTIPMNNVVKAENRRELISVHHDHIEGEFADEMSGIVQWAMGMSDQSMKQMLLNPQKFCPSLHISNLQALAINNPICDYFDECIVYSPKASVNIGSGAAKATVDDQERGLYCKDAYVYLYNNYFNWCKKNGYQILKKPQFIEKLLETANNILHLPGIKLYRERGMKYISGIRIIPFDRSTEDWSNRTSSERLPSPIEYLLNPAEFEAALQKHG